MDAPQTAADRLRWAREMADLSMRALSEEAGLDASHVRLIESGDRDDPRSNTMLALADALGCSLDWLVAGRGEAPSVESLQAVGSRVKESARKTSRPVGSTFTASDFDVAPSPTLPATGTEG